MSEEKPRDWEVCLCWDKGKEWKWYKVYREETGRLYSDNVLRDGEEYEYWDKVKPLGIFIPKESRI